MELNSTPAPETTVLSPIQEKVALSLAAGTTITGAAEASGLHRATIYRWLKTEPAFSAAVQRARTEFILARRDDLHYLSNRAMETLLAILDNPRSSPAVLLRASIFILQRSQQPGKGWFLPEPVPQPDGTTLTDSAVIESQCGSLSVVESSIPEAAGATESDTLQPETGNSQPAETLEAPYSLGVLPSCPIPLAVLERRNFRMHMLDNLDDLKTFRKDFPEEEDPELAA